MRGVALAALALLLGASHASAQEAAPEKVVAVVFDFDGTLAPGYHLKEGLLSRSGIDAAKFWSNVQRRVRTGESTQKAWMKELLANPRIASMSKADLKAAGGAIELYPGAAPFLDQVARMTDARVEFYVVTTGLKEIVEGSAIGSRLSGIYGNSFRERDGKLAMPADTFGQDRKPEMLARIAGKRIPLENVIYVGDGATDRAAFSWIRKRGGKAVVVFDPLVPGAEMAALKLRSAGQVDAVVPIDYSTRGELARTLQPQIASIVRGSPMTAEEAAFRLADRLAAGVGATGAGYSLYRENLAAFLRNGLSDGRLLEVERLGRTSRVAIDAMGLDGRHSEKMARELKRPYRNGEVDAALREHAENLRAMMAEIRRVNVAGVPVNFYLIGSVAKGRMGANSDVDLFFETRNDALSRDILRIHEEFKSRGGRVPHLDGPIVGEFLMTWGKIRPVLDLGNGAALEERPYERLKEIYEQGRADMTVRPNGERLRTPVREDAGAQPNRQVRRDLKAGAMRESTGAGKFAAAFMVKEGVASLETGDPERMKQAARSLGTWEFWGTLGAFTAGAHGANRALELGKVNPRLKGHAGKFVRTGLPLAVGMAASQAMMGELDAKRLAVGTGAFMGAGYLVDGVADRVIRATLGSLPQGRVGRGVYAIGKLAAMLYAGEKLEQGIMNAEGGGK